LIELFDKYVRWKILAHFLGNSNSSFYVKEIARTLGVSPGSVSTAVKSFEGWGLLTKEEKGLAHFYRLNGENALVPPLKRAYGLALILSSRPAERFLEADRSIISIAVYGSYADGSFDEKSDIDILIVAPNKKLEIVGATRMLEEELGKSVNTSLFKLSDWRTMARNGDAFTRSVVGNNVLLYGSGLA